MNESDSFGHHEAGILHNNSDNITHQQREKDKGIGAAWCQPWNSAFVFIQKSVTILQPSFSPVLPDFLKPRSSARTFRRRAGKQKKAVE